MNASRNPKNPFRVGDWVVYMPSERGHLLDVNFSGPAQLTPGNRYRIAAIQEQDYVLIEGYDHPGGGIYWTEFEAAKES